MASVLDFHTHFFSRAFFETLAAQSPLPGSVEERLERLGERKDLELPSEDLQEHTRRWQAEMARFGVEHWVAFGSVPQETSVVAQAAAGSEGKMSVFGTIDPTLPEAVETVEHWLEDLAVRGLVFFPAMHRYRIDSPEAREVLKRLEQRHAIAVVHCGLLRIPIRERLGLGPRIDLTLSNPLHVAAAADEHPQVSFVIPHFGAGFFRETLMAGRQAPNVCVDTSSSNSWTSTQPEKLRMTDVFERTLEAFGIDRILFGTDSGPFPRGWRRDILTQQREALGALGLDDAQRRRILFENAATLLGV